MSHLLRLLFCSALLGCGSTQLAGMSTAHAADSASVSGNSQTVTLKVGQTLALESQGLSIQFVEFKDSRCPTGTQCVWAGHATATLLITRAGAAAQSIVIGTQAPPAMQLPYQATSGQYQFTLVSLEPHPTAKAEVPVASVRASVLIEKQ